MARKKIGHEATRTNLKLNIIHDCNIRSEALEAAVESVLAKHKFPTITGQVWSASEIGYVAKAVDSISVVIQESQSPWEFDPETMELITAQLKTLVRNLSKIDTAPADVFAKQHFEIALNYVVMANLEINLARIHQSQAIARTQMG